MEHGIRTLAAAPRHASLGLRIFNPQQPSRAALFILLTVGFFSVTQRTETGVCI
jgi:hypothetical protein